MREYLAQKVVLLIYEISLLNSEIILLTILLVIGAIVVDGLSAFAEEKRATVGAVRSTGAVGIEGSREIPVKQYVSDAQGLAGRPDAVIKENGFFIPVERKPLAKKLHDRYVAQLLVYMRLIEEFEGKRPPYGYLLLGPNCRRIKIENTPERQQWLQNHLDQMRAILAGLPARATPHPKKCQRCEVRLACKSSLADQIAPPVTEKPAAKEALVTINKIGQSH